MIINSFLSKCACNEVFRVVTCVFFDLNETFVKYYATVLVGTELRHNLFCLINY